MRIYLKNKHTLQVDDFNFKCCIGKNGLSYKKIEGDKKTPVGTFEIEKLYYRKDRIKKIHNLYYHYFLKLMPVSLHKLNLLSIYFLLYLYL